MDARKFQKNYENEISNRMLREALANTLNKNRIVEAQLDQTESDLDDLKDDYDRLEQENAELEYDRDQYYDCWQRAEDGIEELQELIAQLESEMMDLRDELDEATQEEDADA